jgi:hypothetical protein
MTKRTQKMIVTALGWYGMAAILIAFASVSLQLLQPTSPLYLLLSLSGATGLVIETLSKKDYPEVALNIVYGIIALIALARILF